MVDRSLLFMGEPDANMGPDATSAALVFLAVVEAELSFLLADTQEVIRTRSECAFVHLKRSIVADPDIRAKWQRAFQEGETACEKLGSVHLLIHGIFAFKVSGEGERTDLVFNDTIRARDALQRYADGLVLTEWKVARPDSAAGSQLQRALGRARRYSKGVLGGLELTGYRYLVVLSADHVGDLPGDLMEGGVTYRHVNVAVYPSTPSRFVI